MSIGTELVTGQTVDTNSAWLSQQLARLGISVCRHVTVADELEDIRMEIERATAQAECVLISGGLGPTDDDLTRQALAEAMGVELLLSEAHVRHIQAYFQARAREMPEANRVQALFPAGSTPIDNSCGTAPGISARLGQATIFVMPGVPSEMRTMFQRSVAPALKSQTGDAVLLVRTIQTFGAGESQVGQTLHDLMARGRNPNIGTTAQQGVIGVRIYAHAESVPQAMDLLETDVRTIRQRLGRLIFGEDSDTLGIAVGTLLTISGKTLALAESCTGGLIAKMVTDAAGSSAYFIEGMVTYANKAKIRLLGVPAELIATHGAVSAPVAEAMAIGCRRVSKADFAISVTGIAGPGGGSPAKPVGLVYIGLADAKQCVVTEHRFGDDLEREHIRDRAAKTALNRLRLRLLDEA